VLDLLIVYLGLFFLGVIVGLVAVAMGASQRDIDRLGNLFGWVGCVLLIIYMLIKDGMLRGRSLGKAICGVQVLDAETGAPCTIGASAMRNLPLLITPAILVVAIQINGRNSHRWGDGWANTMVVRKSWRRMT